MSFMQAVQSAFANYFTLSGRAPRSEYWYFALFVLLGIVVCSVLDGMLMIPAIGIPVLTYAFYLGTLIPNLALTFRRIHDTDRSAWWLLVAFVPVIGALVLLYFFVQRGTDGDNRFGADPLKPASLEEQGYFEEATPAE